MRRFWFEFEAGTLAQLEELGSGTNGADPVAPSGGGVGVTGRDELECREIMRARIL